MGSSYLDWFERVSSRGPCAFCESSILDCDHQLRSHDVRDAQVLFQSIWINPIYLSNYLSIPRWMLGFCVFCVYEAPSAEEGTDCGFAITLFNVRTYWPTIVLAPHTPAIYSRRISWPRG
jgi:hypothetical protein